MLNIRQKIFVHRYLISLCAKTAYTEAYNTKNPRTAESNGHRLLRNAEVRAAIDEARDALFSRFEIEQDWIIKNLKLIADGNIGSFWDQHKNTIDISKINQENAKCIKLLKIKNNNVEIKIIDPIKALYLLGKYLGMWEAISVNEESKYQEISTHLEMAFKNWTKAENSGKKD